MAEHIFITGASSGLGRRVAELMLVQGHKVSTLSRSALSEARLQSPNLATTIGDVAVESNVKNSFEIATATFGPVSGIVHCAGILGMPSRLGKDFAESWGAVVSTNLVGTFNVLNVGRNYFAEGGGTFIGLSGGGATSPMPGLSAYAASKAGAVRLLETAAVEFAESNIRVVAVAPGVMNTKMVEDTLNLNPTALDPAYLARMTENRAAGEDHTDDAAGLISTLLQSESLAKSCSGRLISAVWDDWQSWAAAPEGLDFEESDLKLRRIVQ